MNPWKSLYIVLLLLLPMKVAAQDVLSDGVIYHHQIVESSTDYQKGNVFQKDFLLAMQLLKESHPAFAEGMEQPFNIDKIVKKGYEDAKEMKDVDELMAYLQRIFSQLHDGHTLITSMLYDNSATYPISYYREGNRYYLWGGTERTAIYLGREIKSINGVPVAEVVDAFRHDFSYENETDREERLRDNVFRNMRFWKNKPFFRKDSTLMITFQDGMTAVVKPTQGWMSLRMAKRLSGRGSGMSPREETSEAFTSSIDAERHLGYLQLNTCFDPYTTLLIMGMRGVEITDELVNSFKGKPNFHDYLKEFFADLQEQEIKTLVIDLRGNSGGCSLISYELLSWLYPIRELKCVTEAIRYSPLYEQFYAAEAKDDIERVKAANQGVFSPNILYDSDTDKAYSEKSIIPEGFSGVDDNSELYNLSRRKIFKGNVLFLQDEKTYSAAADIIIMAKDNGIGKVIGPKGCYLTSNYSSALTWQLPNTGISGMVSHRTCFRPDRDKLNEKELVPDVLVTSSWNDALSGKDNCWEAVERLYLERTQGE